MRRNLEPIDLIADKVNIRFLWVTFQLESICLEITDEGILKALEDLPKDLPTTYRRILCRLRNSESTDPAMGKKVFEIVSAARRPLTLEELREAISIEPGNQTWNTARIVNDVRKLLGCCGSLVIVDEEFSTVQFAHSSVKQHLEAFPTQNDISEYHINTTTADILMGEIVVTYLNLDVLQNMLTNTSSSSQTLNLPDVTVLLTASLPPQNFATSLARKLLKNRKTPGYDVGRDLEKMTGLKSEQTKQSLEGYSFLSYAQEHWLSHTESFSVSSMDVQDVKRSGLWKRLIEGHVPTVDLPWTSEDALALNPSFLSPVAQSHNPALIEYACQNLVLQKRTHSELQRFLDLLPRDELGYKERERRLYLDVALKRAVLEKNGDLVQLLLDKTPADPNSNVDADRCILNEALTFGNLEIVETLISHGADVNFSAMQNAAWSSFGKEAVLLLLKHGAEEIPILDSYRDDVKGVLQECYNIHEKQKKRRGVVQSTDGSLRWK